MGEDYVVKNERPPQRNVTIDETELEPLEVWVESISNTGLMEIRYSAPVLPISNITNVTD